MTGTWMPIRPVPVPAVNDPAAHVGIGHGPEQRGASCRRSCRPSRRRRRWRLRRQRCSPLANAAPANGATRRCRCLPPLVVVPTTTCDRHCRSRTGTRDRSSAAAFGAMPPDGLQRSRRCCVERWRCWRTSAAAPCLAPKRRAGAIPDRADRRVNGRRAPGWRSTRDRRVTERMSPGSSCAPSVVGVGPVEVVEQRPDAGTRRR